MILAIAHGGSGLDDWQGMDLPVLTADKVARALPEARLFVGIGGVKRSMADSTRDKLSNMLPSDHTVDITVHAYDEYTDLVSDLEVGAALTSVMQYFNNCGTIIFVSNWTVAYTERY